MITQGRASSSSQWQPLLVQLSPETALCSAQLGIYVACVKAVLAHRDAGAVSTLLSHGHPGSSKEAHASPSLAAVPRRPWSPRMASWHAGGLAPPLVMPG